MYIHKKILIYFSIKGNSSKKINSNHDNLLKLVGCKVQIYIEKYMQKSCKMDTENDVIQCTTIYMQAI